MSKILVIEDEALVALDMRITLERAGFSVTRTAKTLTEALEAVDADSPDAAILDGNLNGDSSAPVATRLREKAIPFVVVTGYSAEQLKAWLDGAPILSKPYTTAQLVGAVETLARP